MVNASECMACLMCLEVCKRGAIKIKESKGGYAGIYIDADLCVRCGACDGVCPAE